LVSEYEGKTMIQGTEGCKYSTSQITASDRQAFPLEYIGIIIGDSRITELQVSNYDKTIKVD